MRTEMQKGESRQDQDRELSDLELEAVFGADGLWQHFKDTVNAGHGVGGLTNEGNASLKLRKD